MEEACSQPLAVLGPYEPCDLLATALALQPVAALMPESAASAVAFIEAQAHQTAGHGAGQSLVPATTELPADPDVTSGGSYEDTWSAVPHDRLTSSSPFCGAAHCYAAAAGVGLAALRPSLFLLHPAFRISTVATLASLDAVLDPASRPPRTFPLWAGTVGVQRPGGCPEEAVVFFNATEGPEQAAGYGGKGQQQQTTRRYPNDTAAANRSRRESAEARGRPLHPLLRGALLSVFYRLPCVSLRLLVELLEAMHACDFARREVEEHLCPHGKSQRWHR